MRRAMYRQANWLAAIRFFTAPFALHSGSVSFRRPLFKARPDASTRRFRSSSTSRSDKRMELDFTALADIRHVLHELRQLWRESEPHTGKIRRRLQMLQVLFEDLTANA